MNRDLTLVREREFQGLSPFCDLHLIDDTILVIADLYGLPVIDRPVQLNGEFRIDRRLHKTRGA
jgi:hypothetical protein